MSSESGRRYDKRTIAEPWQKAEQRRERRYIPDECSVEGCTTKPAYAWYHPGRGRFVATCMHHRPKGAQTLPRYRRLATSAPPDS